MKIGVDFGTTNSSAGYYDGETVHLIPLEGEATVMPSMIYITREGEQLLGHEAIRLYLQQDTGRPAVYRPFDMGALTEVHSELVVIRRVYSLVDTSAPGRLFQSVKSALRDPDFTGTSVFDRYYSLEELIAIVLSHIRRRAEEHLGGKVDSVLLGRPVTYAERGLPEATAAAVERAAVARMTRAAHLAGFHDVEFAFEPVAAAYSWVERASREATVFVFDFGGGTLDFAVMRLHPEGRAEALATSGLLLGGDDLDSRLVLRLGRHFGAGSTYGPARLPFPDHILDYMAHWQTIPILSRPPFIQTIKSMRRESSAPGALAALECLVSRNYGFQLFQEAERGKRALSEGLYTTIKMNAEDIHIFELLLRRQFEGLIADLVDQIRQAIRQLLAEARIGSEEIDQVIMAGGSSLIPCITDLVADEFGPEKLQQSSPFTSIVSGLAAMAARPAWASGVSRLEDDAATVAGPVGAAIAIGDRVSFHLGKRQITGRVIAITDPTGVDPLLSIEFNDREMGGMQTARRRARDVRLLPAPVR